MAWPVSTSCGAHGVERGEVPSAATGKGADWVTGRGRSREQQRIQRGRHGGGEREGLRPRRACRGTSQVASASGPRALVQALPGGGWPWWDPSPTGRLCPRRRTGAETRPSPRGDQPGISRGRENPWGGGAQEDRPRRMACPRRVPRGRRRGATGPEEKRALAEWVKCCGVGPGFGLWLRRLAAGGLQYVTVPCPRPCPRPAGVSLAGRARQLVRAL